MIKRGMTNDEKREYFRGAAAGPMQSSAVVALPVRPIHEATSGTADASIVAIKPARTATEQEQARAQLDVLADKSSQPQTVQEKAAAGVRLVAEKFEAFRDQQDAFFIYHEGDAVSLGSGHAVDIIRTAALSMSGRVIGRDNIEQVLTILRQNARTLPARTVYQRIGKDGNAYLLDMGDRARRCVRVTAQGITVIEADATQAIFKRGRGYASLPEPVVPTDAAEAWAFVGPLLQGLQARDHLPLIAAKVEHIRCDSPHPVLAFLGPSGSGKTSAARRCMLAIDPFAGDPPSVTADERAIYSSAQSRHSLLIDNIGSTVGSDIENLLCTSSYGSQITIPELYTTADSRTLALHVAWHLTGITGFIRQDDTHSRSLVMRVSEPKGGYKAEAEVRAEFDEQHPQVLGGLLYFLSERMRFAASLPQNTTSDRMVDWLTTGEAIAQSRGATAGKYTSARKVARETRAHDWIEGDAFAAALVAALADMGQGAQPVTAMPPVRTVLTAGPWAGQLAGRIIVAATAKDVCRAVGQKYSFDSAQPPPRTARATGGAIERVQGEMMKVGWRIEQRQVKGGSNSYWVFGAPP